jgi:hypothetical protein
MMQLLMIVYGGLTGWLAGSATHITRALWLFRLILWGQVLGCLLLATWVVFVGGSDSTVRQPNASQILSLACFILGVFGGAAGSKSVKAIVSYTGACLVAIPILISFCLCWSEIDLNYWIRVPGRIVLNGKPIEGDVYRRQDDILIRPDGFNRYYHVLGQAGLCDVLRAGGNVIFLGPLAFPRVAHLALGICTDSPKIDGVPTELVRTPKMISFRATEDWRFKVYLE